MINKKDAYRFLKRFWYLGLLPIFLFSIHFFVNHSSNTNFETEYYDLYIATDSSSTEELEKQLSSLIKFKWTFNIINDDLGNKVKKGLYLIPKGASNQEIIRCLQTKTPLAVQISVGNIRFRNNLIASLCKNLDVRSSAVMRELANVDFIQFLDTSFTPENVYCLFIQDSIWVYRNATAREIVKSVYRNWQRYWTYEKQILAQMQGLTPIDAMILASIVHSESQDRDELPIIAGLYLNRLDEGMKLQADPTVVYSWGTSLERVKKTHLKIKSRYNTYRHVGLPPGPVFTPNTNAIEAVLNPQEHDFFYFVANPELDGKHDFSETYEEHLEKAKAYRGIFR